MNGVYTFLPLEKVHYGSGSVAALPDEVDRLGRQRVLIVTGNTVAHETPLVDRLADLLGRRHAGTFSDVRAHVPESCVQAAAAMAREREVDLLLSVGGGSPVDAAKATAWILAGDGDPPPHIAVPTTLSAAEYSHIAGYTDEEANAKDRFVDRRLTPRVIILDPEMTLATPAWLWSSSGIRALDHAVETLYAPGDHPVQDVLALEAVRDLFAFLPATRQEPEDLKARLRCQMAAWMSLFAPATIKYGLSHTLSKAFGTRYDVPHGVTSCITLPPVMRYVAKQNPGPLARMASGLGVAGQEKGQEEAALAAAEAVTDLIRHLSLPHRLRDVDVPRDAFETIAGDVAEKGYRRDDVLQLLEEAW